MNTNLQNKTFKDPLSLEVQDSNLIVNKNTAGSTSALINRKERYGEKINNSIKEAGKDKDSTKSNNAAPRVKVSIDFAAKQLFQILLIDIKRRNSQFDGILEPVSSAIYV